MFVRMSKQGNSMNSSKTVNQAVRVVLADDSDFFRRTLKKLLEKQVNIRVIGEASNGREAIQPTGCPFAGFGNADSEWI